MTRNLLIITILFGLTACGGVPPVPSDHFYRLTSPQQKDIEKQQISDSVIYVGNFIADGLYNERALLFVKGDEGRELQQHHYHFWITSPPHLLHDYLIDYLRKVDAAPMIIDGTNTKGRIKISGKVLGFEYQTIDSTKTANVVLELRLDKYGEERPIIIKEYRANEPVNGDNMVEIVAAFNRAVLAIYKQFLIDIKETYIAGK